MRLPVALTMLALSLLVSSHLLTTISTAELRQNSNASALPSPSPKVTKAQEKRLNAKLKRKKKLNLSATHGAVATTPNPMADKCFSWTEPWVDGDCELAGPPNEAGLTGPQICFRPDGTGTYRSRGRSTDDDDTYWVRFDVLSNNGTRLFGAPLGNTILGFPKLWMRDLPDPGNWYDFNEDFTFPSNQFPAIASVQPWSAC
jgi:hypothetical protein